MIPLKDENPTKRFPLITIFIIFLNIALFIYEISLKDNLENFILEVGATPYNILYAKGNFKVYFTLISSLFFHAGIAHLLGNMLYLWVFGNNIEDRLGHFNFIIFYLTCGIVANLSHIFLTGVSHIPLIGASGSISGILAAYLVLYPKARILVLMPFLGFLRIIRVPAFLFLGFWIILQFIYWKISSPSYITEGGIAWVSHIGGFFCGLILLPLFLKNKEK